jgi:hypothetical protein
MDPKNKVQKALTDEEVTILGNIQSLLSQLMQANQGDQGAPNGTEQVTLSKAEGELNDEDKKEEEDKKKEDAEKAKKALETTTSDGATASDDTEDKIDENQTETSEKNTDEVSKALAIALSALLKNNESVKKSQETSPQIKALQDLTQVVKGLADNQNMHSDAMAQLLDGLGIAKQLEVNKSIAEKNGLPKGKPITDLDNSNVLGVIGEIAKALNGEKKEVAAPQGNSQIVHKNLANLDVLQAMTGIPVGPKTLIEKK